MEKRERSRRVRRSVRDVLLTDVIDEISQFAPDEWNTIAAGKSPYSSYGWHQGLELKAPAETRYISVRDGHGRLRGVLPTFRLDSAPGNPEHDPTTLFAENLHPLSREAWYPALVGGSRVGHLTELIVDPTADAATCVQVVRALMSGFVTLAADLALEAYWLMYMPSTVARSILQSASVAAMPLFTTADCHLAIRWDTFDGYLDSLSHKRRHAVRREITAFHESGTSIKKTSLSAALDDVSHLLACTLVKHGYAVTGSQLRVEIEPLVHFLDDRSLVFLSEHNAQVSGGTLFFSSGERLYARAAGIDYAVGGRAAEYFNLLFYEPIRHSLRNGVKEIHYGVGSFEAKLGRGAVAEPLWSVIGRPNRPLKVSPTSVRDRNNRAIAAFRDEYERFLKQSRGSEPWDIA